METAPKCLTNDVRWNHQIKSLEVELKKQFAQDRLLKNVEESKESEPYFQPVSSRWVGASHQSSSFPNSSKQVDTKDITPQGGTWNE
jgi:hypothetical protein